MITVTYSSIDGARIRRRFASVAGAQNFAFKWVGEHPEIGSSYAVSGDGVGKIEVIGATPAELFPQVGADTYADEQAAYEAAEREWREVEAAYDRADAEAYAKEAQEWEDKLRPIRPPGCSCSDHQLTYVGCDCDRSYRQPPPLDSFEDVPF